jgi:isoleucyl-tRNA synthetase
VTPVQILSMIDRYFLATGRAMRCCHPRDLLLQVRSYCRFHRLPLEMTEESMEFAVENYRDELATLFIVSQAELAEGLEGAVDGEEVKGLRIRVEKAEGEKCERCWNYATTVGESDAHPSVCHRCREALVG